MWQFVHYAYKQWISLAAVPKRLPEKWLCFDMAKAHFFYNAS